ncbi:MAG: acyl-CoA dehydrogenase [Actinomycetota bacterium]|nr:MAG: acyl-CoA dehydrogenase [Actinomycetota bacterium]
MAWDFITEPEFQEKLDWTSEFVREHVEPLDVLWPWDNYKELTPEQAAVVLPLKEQVRAQGLWACHLGPELGGKGYGQLKLAQLNEILGRTYWGPRIFGCAPPDTGNAEILAHFGTAEQKARYLQPLLDGDIVSCYSMTEPQGGADPAVFTTTATRDGDEWIINGWKYFSSNARYATFLIVMAVTDPNAGLYQGMSMFIVPADAPGVDMVRHVAAAGEPDEHGSHSLIHYDNVRVPQDAMLGGEGQAFLVAQTRLGGGRVHHSMRAVGMAQRSLDAMAERALSRVTKGQQLANFEFVQGDLADSYLQVQQLRLLVMYTAWKIDKYEDYNLVRKEISAIKVAAPKVLEDVARRAIQLHGALGISNDVPFMGFMLWGIHMALADGPTEVHKVTIARQLLRDYQGIDEMWPTEYIPHRREKANQELLGK